MCKGSSEEEIEFMLDFQNQEKLGFLWKEEDIGELFNKRCPEHPKIRMYKPAHGMKNKHCLFWKAVRSVYVEEVTCIVLGKKTLA